MKKKKSFQGFLADTNNPVSMKEILRELKEDKKREEADEKKELQQLRALLKR